MHQRAAVQYVGLLSDASTNPYRAGACQLQLKSDSVGGVVGQQYISAGSAHERVACPG